MKSTTVQIRLQPKEKEAFEKASDLAGMTLSAWIRERLRGGLMSPTQGQAETREKQATTFRPDLSGSPSGGPRGARNRTTLAIEALLDGEAEALTRKATELAKAGDLQALRICLDRLVPPRLDRLVTFALPKLEKAADAVKATAAIVEAVADGALTPGEAAELSRVVDCFTRTIEFEERMAKLE